MWHAQFVEPLFFSNLLFSHLAILKMQTYFRLVPLVISGSATPTYWVRKDRSQLTTIGQEKVLHQFFTNNVHYLNGYITNRE